MTQKEVLNLMNTYNSTDRAIIKFNLKRIMKEKKFKLRDIEKLGYNRFNAASWTNKASNNIPMLDQAFNLAVSFKFDVRELIKVA